MSLLILAADAAFAEAVADRLRLTGQVVAGTADCRNLVREVVRLAPQAVVLTGAVWDAETQAALQGLAEAAARPVLVLGLPADAALPAAPMLLACGVQAWLPPGLAPVQEVQALAAAVPLALARFAHDQAQARALSEVRARLDERKWVERAKGMLMRHHQLAEDDAFALLRNASMHANLRVGEVSRSLVEAAEAAEAVNRAGQMRMLSQRHVKALAQRAAGIDRNGATEQLAQCTQRLQDNLDRLDALVPEAARGLLGEVADAWAALRNLTSASPPPLDDADRAAEVLLQAADRLTTRLDLSGSGRSLRIVNQCGRQRMLVQRLAKQALLAGLSAYSPPQDALATVAAIEDGLRQLEQAPLTNDDIRSAQAQVRGQWQRMRQDVARAAGADAATASAALVRESEALLSGFERLTSLYEHSLQVLLG